MKSAKERYVTKNGARGVRARARYGFWLCVTACCAAGAAVAQEWKPERNVEIVVSSGAGGAADRSARTIQRFLQQIPGIPSVSVNNKPGGGGTTAALGGHVEVWAGTVGNALPYVQDGRIRVLGISAPQRQAGGFAAAPTFREQGIDAVYSAWRGFLAPKGLTAAQTAYWDRTFARIVEDADWKAELEKNAWGREFKGAAEARRHLEAEHLLLEKILADLGLVKR